MTNSFSDSLKEVWAAEQQRVFYKTNVGMKISDIPFKTGIKTSWLDRRLLNIRSLVRSLNS